MRLLLLFPATAIAAPEAEFGTIWRLSRGHVWRIFWVSIVAMVPVLLLGFVALPFLVRMQQHGGVAAPWLILLDALLNLVTVPALAALASRLFQIYARPAR